MVATTDAYSTEVGVEVLRSGGNAVDATVAAFFALAVVNPEAGNIGGGSYVVLRTAGGEAAALDARSCAPLAATANMFVDAQGEVTEQAVIGHLSVAVPGSVRGIWELHQRFGRTPWRALLGPAIQLAGGFLVRERFLKSFTPTIIQALERFPESARLFLPAGAAARVGDVFRQPELAATLERLRDGPDDFYSGRTAELIVAEMERGGGLLTTRDLASYEAQWREPTLARYRGREILSMPPSSSGGITLALSANILEHFPVGSLSWHGPEHVHLLAEAWRHAYADRNHYIADPAFADVPVAALTSPAYAAWRARDIEPDRSSSSAVVRPGVDAFLRGEHPRGAPRGGRPLRRRTDVPPPDGHTTHLSIVDPEGAAVSLTTTINSWYGSKVTVQGAGFLLNNDMDDFTARPGAPNQFGLVQGEANRIEPGKRMLSAMTPTIVLDRGGRLCMVVGSPGGSSIITTVFQVISSVIDHELTLSEAVHAPRVHHQHLPDQIFVEPGGLPDHVRSVLSGMGHRVVEREDVSGDVQAIVVGADGTLEGRSDPRRGGTAAGF